MSSEGKVLKSRRAAWRHFEENAQPSSRLIPQPLQAQDADPSPHRSPGMQYFLRSHSSSSELRACRSRADILRAPAGSLGPKTESFRSAAVASVLSYPISTRARTNTFSAPFEALPDARPSALAAAQKLLPELPESCFVEMAGGPAAYAATPPVVPAARRRGAGSGGPRTMPAVYSLQPHARISLRSVRV